MTTESKKIQNVQLGSDIEYFLQNKVTGEIVSAEGFVKGTKKKPFVFDKSSKFWATSLDNVSYEGNIPPVKDKAFWYHNINKLREYINSTLPEELCSIAIPSHEFDSKYLATPNAQRFGCEPSLCVWTRSTNIAPLNNTNIRSTGGHIHASWENMEFEDIESWIKSMDLFVGVPSVLMEPENKRRTLYGKAGEFRHSPEMDRAEYRVLSSFMLDTKERIDYTYDQTQAAIDYVNQGQIIDLESPLAKDIIKAINNSNKEIAETIVRELNIPVLV